MAESSAVAVLSEMATATAASGVAATAAVSSPPKSTKPNVEAVVTTVAMTLALCIDPDYIRICRIGDGIYVSSGDVKRVARGNSQAARKNIGATAMFESGAYVVAEPKGLGTARDPHTARLNHCNQASVFVPLENIRKLSEHRASQHRNTNQETTERLRDIYLHLKSQTDGSSPAILRAPRAVPAPPPPPSVPPPPPTAGSATPPRRQRVASSPSTALPQPLPSPTRPPLLPVRAYCNYPSCVMHRMAPHVYCVAFPPSSLGAPTPPQPLLQSPPRANPYYGEFAMPSLTDSIRASCPPARELFCTGMTECPSCNGAGVMMLTAIPSTRTSHRKRSSRDDDGADGDMPTLEPAAKRPNTGTVT